MSRNSGAEISERSFPLREMLVDFDGRLLHFAMRFARAPGEQKIGSARDPLVSVFGIKSQSEQGCRRAGSGET